MPPYITTDPKNGTIIQAMAETSNAIETSFEHFRLKESLEHIVNLARTGNRFLNETEPWKIYKRSEEEAGHIIGLAVQLVGSVAVLLKPFLPESSSRILKVLSTNPNVSWKNSKECFVKPGRRISPLEPLFHKVSAPDLRDRLERLRSIETSEVQI